MQDQDNLGNLFSREIHGYKFNFQPFSIGTTESYHVNVSGDDGSRQEFRMKQQDDGKWMIEGENLPEWINELQDEIVKAVLKHD